MTLSLSDVPTEQALQSDAKNLRPKNGLQFLPQLSAALILQGSYCNAGQNYGSS